MPPTTCDPNSAAFRQRPVPASTGLPLGDRTVESAQEIGTCEVLARDESFFTALLAADHELLGSILADDFLIIDVLSGQVGHRNELLGAISSGQLRFAEVTRMVMSYRGDEVTVQSRYTHAYARESGRWRLMSAQGTPTSAPRVGGA